jgi:hypothetical protein
MGAKIMREKQSESPVANDGAQSPQSNEREK